MYKWLALFRGINVGGNNILPMKKLITLLSETGCKSLSYYIQSGNLLFEHEEADKTRLSDLIAEQVSQHFGFRPQILLLELSEFIQLARQNPFTEAEVKPTSLHLYFLAAPSLAADLPKLNRLKTANEAFVLEEKVFYLQAPDGIGRSKLAAKVEDCLGVSTTARNWNTVTKLVAMAELLS